MNMALLRLAGAEIRRSRVRSGFAVLALAAALVAIAFFGREIEVGRAALAAYYADTAATRLLIELHGVDAMTADNLAVQARHLPGLAAAAGWIDGNAGGIRADTSFLVFANQRQRESLGAGTAVIGAGAGFDPRTDYVTRVGDAGPVLNIPLLPVEGDARPPRDGELLVAADIADYVGIRPGAVATVDMREDSVDPPIVRRLENVRLIGTFDVIGPDRGRFEPFWQLAEADQTEVLTVRHPVDERGQATTVPVILPAAVVGDFLAGIERARTNRPALTERLTVRALTLEGVPAAAAEVTALLRERGLEQTCNLGGGPSFCVRVPGRNNFAAALQHVSRYATGASYFSNLLLLLVAIGSGALQVQAAVERWRECGLLRSLGFGAGQVMLVQAAPLVAMLVVGLALALLSAALAGLTGASFWRAIAATLIAASLGAAPGLLLPAFTRPVMLLREFA